MGFHFKNMDGNQGHLLTRQSSVYSLTFDEIQNTLGGLGKDFGSMNMDEFLKNIWTSEEMQAMTSASGSGICRPAGQNLQKQPSLTLPRTLSQKTVDEVWREMFKECCPKDDDNKSGSCLPHRQQTLGELTLEEFLVRAGVVREDGQLTGHTNNVSTLLDELTSNNHITNASFAYVQPSSATTFITNSTLNNGTSAASNNTNQVRQQLTNHPMDITGGKPQQQPFMNQAITGYSSAIPSGVSGRAGSNGEAVRIGDPIMSKGTGHAGGVAGFDPTFSKLVSGSAASVLGSNGIAKKERDVSACPVNPPVYSGVPRGRRGFGAVEKVVERRQRRMIKNRESAARSRARKQAYTMELEAEVAKLKVENQLLQQKQMELLEIQKKQILEMLGQQQLSKRRRLRRTMTGPW